jgi:hypothetical protein
MNMDYPKVSWRISQRSLCLNTDIAKAIIDLRKAKIQNSKLKTYNSKKIVGFIICTENIIVISMVL